MKTTKMKNRITSKITPLINHSRIESKNIYESIEPLYIVTLFMGLSPYIYKFTSKSGYTESKLMIIYSISILIIFHLIHIEGVHITLTTNPALITSIMDSVHIYYNNMLSTIIVFWACLKHKRFIKFMTQLAQVDEHFYEVGFHINHNKIKFQICVHLLIIIGIPMYLEIANCAYTWKHQIPLTWPCWFYCYYSLMLSSLMECQFLSCVNMLKHRFYILNKQLYHFKPDNRNNKIKTNKILIVKHNKLKIFEKFHADLSDCCRTLNAIFSFQILFTVGYNFLQATLSNVHVFQKLIQNLNDHDMTTTFIWGSYYISRLFILAKICDATIYETNKTGRILHNIYINITDDDTNSTILMFSKQLMHNKLRFTGMGFFPIDMTLFFTVIAAICLYIMIIVQMDSTIPVFSEHLFFNDTNKTID